MTIKIITLNLFEGGLLFDRILAFLHQEKPDILLVQEVNAATDPHLPPHFRSMQVLTEALPSHESFFSPELMLTYPEGDIDIGNAIFSTFPITKTGTTELNAPYGIYPPVAIGGDFSKHPKNMVWCELRVGEQVLNVFNIHGLWELNGGDTPERLKMSQLILEQIKNKPNVIVGGDFNVKPNTQTIANLEQHLTNVFKNDLHTTFNILRKDLTRFPGYATAVVDMLFVSPDLRVVAKNCPQVDISDHLPLVCEIRLG